MDDIPKRPLPLLTDENTPFWTGGENGELLIYRCQSCSHYIHPPLPMCGECKGRDVKPEVVSGKATVVSFTINHMTWQPGLPVPYVLALVELVEQEGVRLTTELVGVDPEDVVIGMQVEVTFEQQDDVYFPLFTPIKAG